MAYIAAYVFECLLLAVALGAALGAVLRGVYGNRQSKMLEQRWQDRFVLVNETRAQLTTQALELEHAIADWKIRFTALTGDHTKLQKEFAYLSGQVPALETALVNWEAKSLKWNAEKLELQSDLRAATEAYARLEDTTLENELQERKTQQSPSQVNTGTAEPTSQMETSESSATEALIALAIATSAQAGMTETPPAY